MRKFNVYTVEQYMNDLQKKNITREIKEIHLHHTWKPTIQDYKKAANKEKIILGMWRYHTKTLGWMDIGQTVTIDPEGYVWQCREINIPPASIKGRNADAFAVEMIGNFDEGYEKLEGVQLNAVINLIKELFKLFHINRLVFHREYSTKTCPGTSIRKEDILEMVNKNEQQISDWAETAWKKAIKNGINDGVGPKNYVTEEQMMVFLDRLGLLD